MEPLSWLTFLRLIGRHWKLLVLLIVATAAFVSVYRVGAKSRDGEVLQAKLDTAAAQQEAETAKRAQANAQAALAVAIAASERNNNVLPPVRKRVAARVAAAGGATRADSLQLGAEAVSDYEAAAGQLSGARSR